MLVFRSSVSQVGIFSQSIRYTGVGAHHHKGVAEQSIGTVMSIARTMMLHTAVHWPEVADASLWPFAVLHAINILNNCSNPDTASKRGFYEVVYFYDFFLLFNQYFLPYMTF